MFMTVVCVVAAPHKGKRAIKMCLYMATVNDGLGPDSLTAILQ